MNAFCIQGLAALAAQIEKAKTREQALGLYEEFRMTPASHMLPPAAEAALTEIIAKKLRTKHG